jgi:superfamily II DNA or RNA helicase
LADEVGLGKTIEAGLVLRELKLRGLVRRTLVVAPKGLARQWVSEMQTHFNEDFQLVLGEDIGTLQRLAPTSEQHRSAWSLFDQVIVSLDSVKPVDKRRGWNAARLAEYNRSRFEDLVTAGWDLVVVDEAHRLAGSTDQVARFKLGKGLAEAAPYVLLLSATPHQGKTDAFHRLMSLLDEDAFPDVESVSRERVAPYVIRTEKRKAIDAEGKPLFKPRQTRMVPVKWEERHALQRELYEVVTDYVREGYNQALKDKQRHFGFLMILMQRLVVSSTRAIRTTLERRLDVLNDAERQGSQRLADLEAPSESNDTLDDLYDMDGQELLEALLKSQVAAMRNEGAHVDTLLAAARRCEQAGSDAKAEALIDWIYQIQSEENEPDLKVLVFTEFVPTQEMLREFLEARGISVTTLNGSMGLDERNRAQEKFRNEVRVLVSTDAGGEGLNLQFCHVIFNYDIPWNPMRLEQRIGRVDRIGQSKPVRAINFVFEDSVEFRVREVLEEKLSIIFAEVGIDKTGDVLDSAEAGELFEEMYAAAILNPDQLEASVDKSVSRIRDEICSVRESSVIYGLSDEPDVIAAERLRSHPLPHWVERMTIGYLHSNGGTATHKRTGWELTWPDGHTQHKCVFNTQDAEKLGGSSLVNLEDNRVRGLALSLPQVAAGQPVPCISLKGLPNGLSGVWGLFEIRLQAAVHQSCPSLRVPMLRRSFISVFLSEENKLFLPTARHIWDLLHAEELAVQGILNGEESESAHARLLEAAESAGQDLFETLRQSHFDSLIREEERGMVAFGSRRKAAERVGLPEVRQYRLTRCDAEEHEWRKELETARQILPEIRPLLLLKIVPGSVE